MTRRTWIAALAWLLVVIGAPWAGHLARRNRPDRCHLDGQPIEPSYRVRMVDASGESAEFCCLQCALRWSEDRATPDQVFVTDEISGREIPAREAFFVRSTVITNRATGNSMHAFAERGEALRHAASADGRLLAEHERPFAEVE